MRHFYRLYERDDELIRIAAFFLKDGIDKHELCFWVVPDTLDVNNIAVYLRAYMDSIDSYLKEGKVKVVKSSEWYIQSGQFDMDSVLEKWGSLYKEAMAGGFCAMRVIGDSSWLKQEHWKALLEYESRVNRIIKDYNLTALCVFNVKKFKSIIDISDIITRHEACFVSG